MPADGVFRTRTVECAGGLQLRVGPRKGGSESQQARRFIRGGSHGFWRSLVYEYVRSGPLRKQRFIVLGTSDRYRLLVVSYAERPPLTRIISARMATRHEL